MSFTYHFAKSELPLDQFREAIESVIDPGDEHGNVPEGTWREQLLSAMMRERSDHEEGQYGEIFLAAGGIRGVAVYEEADEVHIKVSSFSSRTDQYLAARFAWEAMQLGAEVWKEGHEEAGALTTDQLGSEAIESTHAEWWKLSKGTLAAYGDGQYPVLGGIISLSVHGQDASMSDEDLEAHYISRVAKLGDAFPCTTVTFDMAGVGEKSIHILQWELSSLLSKTIDGVKLPGETRGAVPLDALIELAGHHLSDGCESWVCAPANQFEDGLLDRLNEYSFGGTSSGELTDADWRVIAQAPIIAFVLVAAADGNVDKKELKRFAEILGGLAEQQGHLPTARMMQTAMTIFAELIPRLVSGEVDPLRELESFVSLADSKMSPDDAGKVKMSVLVLAKEVAEASGGFFGFGSKIDKDEERALAVLIHVLGFSG
ncbi:hypothetical protein ACFQY0_15070 [Haloferula chungangensis]|uniref:Uncharacterized protein n=1 Tax=Haloferula chungangensis TaxID=1048331 RepID=A0ABW2LA79_9BACT